MRAASWTGPLVWGLHLALPLLALALLVARPEIDVLWEHHNAHFALVVGVALVNAVLAERISRAAAHRSDARLFLVSLTFLAASGFLGVHALATPGVILGGANTGFIIATPVGLLLAALFAAASALDLEGDRAERVVSHHRLLRGGLLALIAAWAAASLLRVGPLDTPRGTEDARGALAAMAVAGAVLFGAAAVRFYALHRRRPSVMLVSVLTAFTLLAQAMIALAATPKNWHVSWWEWHLLMAAGFGLVAYSAYVEYRREGAPAGLFDGIALNRSVRRVREEYAAALEALVSAMRSGASARPSGRGIEPEAARVAEQFGLTEGQGRVLTRAAEALAAERDQIVRLDALVAVGTAARVILDETDLLRQALAAIAPAWPADSLRVGLVREGALVYPPELAVRDGGGDRVAPQGAVASAMERCAAVTADADGSEMLVLPLTVKGRPAGVLEIARAGGGAFADRDRAVLQSLASQLSIALENARLYRQIDVLFRQYMSSDVATALLADPDQATLGGASLEVTILFADLRGYTAFSERTSPDRVVALLNRYFGAAIPCIVEHGGIVNQFIGDAIMAIFNAPTRQPDHALRAGRAGLAMQAAVHEVATDPAAPRFRVGINTGVAVVGNVGNQERRTYTATGDTVNLAARLEGVAEAGQVVIGERTRELMGEAAVVEPLGAIEVKGKSRPVRPFVLRDVVAPAR